MDNEEKAEAYDDLIHDLWTGAIYWLECAEEECDESSRSRHLSFWLGKADGHLITLREHYERNIGFGRNAELSEMLEYFYEDGLMHEIYKIDEAKKKPTKKEIRDIVRRAIASVKTMAVLAGVNEERRFKNELAKYIEKAKQNEEGKKENESNSVGT